MLHVTDAKYIGDYKISVEFSDGCRFIADFESVIKSLQKTELSPVYHSGVLGGGFPLRRLFGQAYAVAAFPGDKLVAQRGKQGVQRFQRDVYGLHGTQVLDYRG